MTTKSQVEHDVIEMLEQQLSVIEVNRQLVLMGEVSPTMWAEFAPAFMRLDKEDGPIDIHITSDGGDIYSGFAIHDLIKNSHNDVTIVGHGMVASIATLIMQAGKKRYLSKNCTFMIHQASIYAEGSFHKLDLLTQTQELNRLNKMYLKHMSSRSVIPLKDIAEMCKKDSYLSAAQAIKFGFVDGYVPRSRKNT
jgi:ATP-dependent Clp protease protease subunit